MNSPDRRNSVLNVQNSSGTTFCTNSLVTLKLKLVREKSTRSLLQSSDKRFSGYLVTDVKSLKYVYIIRLIIISTVGFVNINCLAIVSYSYYFSHALNFAIFALLKKLSL